MSRYWMFLVLMVGAVDIAAQTGPYSYYPLTPCRIVDTRNAISVNGGPVVVAGSRRDFAIKGQCGVPVTAKAVSVNVTVTNSSSSSWLTMWPSGGAVPLVSSINFDPNDWAIANGAIVGLSSSSQDLSVMNAVGSVHVILDVTGYFQ